jgi:hypothetical protein
MYMELRDDWALGRWKEWALQAGKEVYVSCKNGD